jgi:hypothetical protein
VSLSPRERVLLGKGQYVRLVDVFFLGPFMVWAGSTGRLPGWASAALVVSGLATIAYNARNYQRVARLERSQHELPSS